MKRLLFCFVLVLDIVFSYKDFHRHGFRKDDLYLIFLLFVVFVFNIFLGLVTTAMRLIFKDTEIAIVFFVNAFVAPVIYMLSYKFTHP